MLYLFHGSDITKSRAKAHELIGALQKKKSGAELFSVNSENWTSSQFEEYIGAQGLFEKKYIVFLDQILEEEQSRNVILEKMEIIDVGVVIK